MRLILIINVIIYCTRTHSYIAREIQTLQFRKSHDHENAITQNSIFAKRMDSKPMVTKFTHRTTISRMTAQIACREDNESESKEKGWKMNQLSPQNMESMRRGLRGGVLFSKLTPDAPRCLPAPLRRRFHYLPSSSSWDPGCHPAPGSVGGTPSLFRSPLVER